VLGAGATYDVEQAERKDKLEQIVALCGFFVGRRRPRLEP